MQNADLTKKVEHYEAKSNSETANLNEKKKIWKIIN